MSDDIFRMVVAAGVAIAALSFVVQAIVGIATLGAAKKMQQKVAALSDRVEPVIAKFGPTVDKVGPILDKAIPVLEKAQMALDKVRPSIDKIGPIVDRIGPMVEKFGPVADKASELLSATNHIVQETGPQISEISNQLVEITRTGRQQVERIGDLMHDVGDRARTRLEQIDATVGNTVEQVEQVSQNMKRAVTRPVREVNGIAAGVAAAMTTLVKGPRKSSVDSATQDEEMFI
jgi:ABC-type transporter Mla subunit MlaD